jgi:hypothetical protein
MDFMKIPYVGLSNALTSISQRDAVDLGSCSHRSVTYISNDVDREPWVDLDSARTILDAHQLNAVQNTDRMLSLNEMRLVARGTHREVLENNDYYHCLVAGQ